MKYFFTCTFFVCVNIYIQAQKTITLNDFLSNYSLSLDNKKNNIQSRLNKSTYKLFKKTLLPDFSFSTDLPNYNRSISQISQPDGTFTFGELNRANSVMRVSVSQPLIFSGGSITFSNSFNRLDIFGLRNNTSYSASWLNISLNQPLNLFNPYKWDRRIQKTKLEFNELTNKREKIIVKEKIVKYYFSILKIKNEEIYLDEELDFLKKFKTDIVKLIVQKQKSAYDSIEINIRIKKIKQRLYKAEKQKILQKNLINSFFKSNKFSISENDSLVLPIISKINLDENYLIRNYNSVFEVLKKNTLLELQKRFQKLKSENHFTANLSAGFGFNNSSDVISDIFQTPNESQNFSISLNIPVLDFGKRKINLENILDRMDIVKINLKNEKLASINKIKTLCQNNDFLFNNYLLNKEEIIFLDKKISKYSKLLFNEKILMNTFFRIKNDKLKNEKDLILNLESIYLNILELEKITLEKIL